MTIAVIGAGMAGLLSAAMLRQDCEAIYEAARSLPNNHSAVLRFRSSIVADVLGIPFKRVQAMKAVEPWQNSIADAISYSRKTNGSATLRSSITASGSVDDRYIAPPDLIERMYGMSSASAMFSSRVDGRNFFKRHKAWVSTIPMPALMEILDYPRRKDIEFKSVAGNNLIAQLLGVDVYCSLYVPNPNFPAARISITGNQLIAERYDGWTANKDVQSFAVACALRVGLGKSSLLAWHTTNQPYAKILPIDEGERRRFIMWATDKFNIYSVGRYATWKPGLLLDDAVNDVRVVQRLIADRSEAYNHKIVGVA